MVEVELVGGEYDGLRFEIARRQDAIDVPLAFLYGEDGTSFVGVESLLYEDLKRKSEEGRPLYGFAQQLLTTFPGGDPPD